MCCCPMCPSVEALAVSTMITVMSYTDTISVVRMSVPFLLSVILGLIITGFLYHAALITIFFFFKNILFLITYNHVWEHVHTLCAHARKSVTCTGVEARGSYKPSEVSQNSGSP